MIFLSAFDSNKLLSSNVHKFLIYKAEIKYILVLSRDKRLLTYCSNLSTVNLSLP